MDYSALFNGTAGFAALVMVWQMRPAVQALRKIAEMHDERLDEHDERLEVLEAPRRKPRRRAKR